MKLLFALLVVVGLGVFAYHEYNRANDLDGQLAAAQGQISSLNQQIAQLKAAPKKEDWRFNAVKENPLGQGALDTSK